MWPKHKLIQGLFVAIPLIALGIILLSTRVSSKRPDTTIAVLEERESIIISSHATMEFKSLEDLIQQSDLIVHGAVSTATPARWNTPDGTLPHTVTLDTISANFIIYTDMVFEPKAILKGNVPNDQLIVRTFGGSVGKDHMTIDAEELKPSTEYVIFLAKDTGSTAQLGPRHYLVLGATQGVYEITEGRVVAQTALRGEQQRTDPAQLSDDKALAGMSMNELIRQIDQAK
ncbi:hypothetical protein [Herpetosiphon llansteffanensis]|uniref:hypothetical protein n=1 Tax=Herpetosiphon llansteffanensis TaxID=2094568 RepID=UPI000D7C6292|nr:hypothetical protein [Herpetosiphon llansteffanensis]